MKNKLFDVFCSLGARKFFCWMSDKTYLKTQYYLSTGEVLDLSKPLSYNEKLQWLKLYDRNPLYTDLVDKYKVKAYISEKIGDEYVIPTLGVWDKFDDIDFEKLPTQFVLKTTHDSGGLVICKDKKNMDYVSAKKKIVKSLKKNYFWTGREWPYKNVKPRIIAEPYIEDTKTKELRDYKFFAFDGSVKALFIATERQNANQETTFDFFDSQYNHIDATNGHPNADPLPEKPENFEKMIELASVLSKGFPHVRVDFYEANGSVLFGEMTFYHNSGMIPFEPKEWGEEMGSWITLPST